MTRSVRCGIVALLMTIVAGCKSTGHADVAPTSAPEVSKRRLHVGVWTSSSPDGRLVQSGATIESTKLNWDTCTPMNEVATDSRPSGELTFRWPKGETVVLAGPAYLETLPLGDQSADVRLKLGIQDFPRAEVPVRFPVAELAPPASIRVKPKQDIHLDWETQAARVHVVVSGIVADAKPSGNVHSGTGVSAHCYFRGAQGKADIPRKVLDDLAARGAKDFTVVMTPEYVYPLEDPTVELVVSPNAVRADVKFDPA